MAMHANKHAAVDFVMPDGQIRMIRVDLDFWVDFWILGAVIGHGDEHRFLARLNAFDESIKEMPNRCGFLSGLFVPCPQHERAWENCRYFRH